MCDTKNYFNQIKSIQDLLRKKGLQKYYQSAILGFTVLRRLTQTLDLTRDEVVAAYEDMVANNEEIDTDLLISIANEKFYNVTRFNFENLLNDPQHIYANVTKMIRGFSNNIYEILGNKGLNLEEVVSKINEKKILYSVIEKYSKLDFSRENMSNTNMGALFGELVVLLYGTPENGENWTPDDFVKCCTRLLLAEGCEWIKTGFVSNCGRKSKNTEEVLIFSKGKARELRPDAKKDKAEPGVLHYMSGANGMLPTGFNYPKPIKMEHQAEKPVELLISIINYLTIPGEVILDQFAGSGVTGEAAIKTERKSILIEVEERYIDKIKKRLNLMSYVFS